MSNSAFAGPDFLTMAHVIGAVEKSLDITEGMKRDIRGAITTMCGWFQIEPDKLIAHPSNLRPRLKRLSPGGLGISRKRISNVKSAVKHGLAIAGCLGGHSYFAPLTPDWVKLQASLPDTYTRASLSRLIRYCSARGLSPGEINDAVMQDFLEALTNE